MSRITIGVIAGLILGIFSFLAGNYMLKTFFSSYFITSDVQKTLTKPTLDIVSELVPQRLEVVEHVNYYTVSWYTPKPVIAYLVLIKEPVPFTEIQGSLQDTKKVLFLKVDNVASTEHKINVDYVDGFNYFYILEQQGSWVIPYGQKIYKQNGADEPYSFVKK